MKSFLVLAACVAVVYSAALTPEDQLEELFNDPNFQRKLAIASERTELHEDALLDVPGLIQKYGYPCETYEVTTPDGYMLTMHRIPHGKNSDNSKDRKPFFLQHGILSSSADWVISGVGKGLGYILADAGYDVWMGNFRGNRYSRKHTYLNPDRDGKKFWDFSWHELGIFDLPVMIDFVLEQTGYEKLLYAGHSQGTTTFYIMCSEKPEYNDKIMAQFSLAPIAFMGHMTSPIMKFIAIAEGGLGVLLKVIGINEFFPSTDFLTKFGGVFCGGELTHALCTNAIFMICGFSTDQMNATLLPILMGHTPAGSSTKQFLHYAQEVNSGHFRQWDYGPVGNWINYKHLYPADYNLKKITAPVFLIYSHNDWLSAETDVNKLYKQLGNCQGKFLVADRKFNHLDYMYGISAPELVYSKVVSLASRYK